MEQRSAEIMKPSTRKRRKKGKFLQLLEYGVAATVVRVVKAIPHPIIYRLSHIMGEILYLIVPRRRAIALENLRNALGPERTEKEITSLARRSWQSFCLTCFDMIKFHGDLTAQDARERLRKVASEEIEILFHKARRIHEESGGCIFVTPHLGNWEFLPHVSAVAGIPLVVVARPLDNVYLERFIYQSRTDTGQIIIPKKNALMTLHKTLRQGKSIGLLPDQGIKEGIPVDFFGRKALTTPVPALLSVTFKRPIVLVACCRKGQGKGYEGFVSDPLWPGTYQSEKEEIFRLTREMNKTMEEIILRYPDQYCWIHNRWKTYRRKRDLFG
jgi:Kdo2-lipid IVA lauroyltransferase/acyltransferase